MPVRLRITLVFSLLVCIVLSLVFFIIYYFATNSRERYIDSRLTNVAITTGRFLSRSETFQPYFIQKIDSLTAIAFTHKTIIAYDSLNRKIYSFNDDDEDAMSLTASQIRDIKQKGKIYERQGERDVVYYWYNDQKYHAVIIAAGYDIFGLQNIKELFFILLVSFFTGLLITLLLGYFFSDQLLKPLGRIAEDVEEISAQSLSRRINSTRSKDEWYKLASTLNALLDRLQESFEMQRRFISNASHELSTPITSISSQLQVSLQKNRSAEEYRKDIYEVYKEVRHMGKLTRALLEVAKASGDKGGLDFRRIRIDETIMEIPAEIMRVNKNYKVQFQMEHIPDDEEELLVFGNDILLQSAIRNIVLNACKYSDDNEAVLELTVKNEMVNISIKDKGKGIPAGEITKIFEPFYRIEEDHPEEGFGLGLALVKRIINLHRGTVTIQSIKNEGTEFTVLLPVAKTD